MTDIQWISVMGQTVVVTETVGSGRTERECRCVGIANGQDEVLEEL